MLKRISLVNNLKQGVVNTPKYFIGAVIRLEKKIFDKKNKNYAKQQLFQAEINIVKQKYENLYDNESILALSTAESAPKKTRMKHFMSNNEEANKAIKHSSNLKVEEQGQRLLEKEQNQSIEGLAMTNEAREMNQIRESEWSKFKSKYFKKNEIKRLLKKEDYNFDRLRKKYNYLNENYFQAELFDKTNKIANQDFEDNKIAHEEYHVDHHEEYNNSINKLVNAKTNDVLVEGKTNAKLRALQEAGYLDGDKEIDDVLRILKDKSQSKRQNLINDYKEKESILPDSEKEITINIEPETKSEGVKKTTNENQAQTTTDKYVKELYEESVKMEEISQYLQKSEEMDISDYYKIDGSLDFAKVYKSFPLLFKDKVKRQELENLVGIGLGSYDTEKDVLHLIQFISDFVTIEDKLKEELYVNLETVKSIKSYENQQFDARRNNSLELRGLATFDKLSQTEKINYVVHNIKDHTKAFELFEKNKKDFHNNMPVLLALHEKVGQLGQFHNYYYKKSEFLDLKIASSETYKQIVKSLLKNLSEFNLKQVSGLCLSISQISKRELGYYNPALFKAVQREFLNRYFDELRIMELMCSQYKKIQHLSLSTDIKEQIESKEIIQVINSDDNDQIDQEEKISTLKYQTEIVNFELWVLAEGLQNLGCLNHSTPAEIQTKSLNVIHNSIDYARDSYTLRRQLLITTKLYSSFIKSHPLLIKSIISRSLNILKNKFIDRIEIESIIQIFRTTALISCHNDPTSKELTLVCKETLYRILPVIKKSFMKDFTLHQLSDIMTILVKLDLFKKDTKALVTKHALDLILENRPSGSSTIPTLINNLALSDIYNRNPSLKKLSKPLHVSIYKFIFGLKAFDFNVKTPQFEPYNDMYDTILKELTNLNMNDYVLALHGLQLVDMPIQTEDIVNLHNAFKEFKPTNSKQKLNLQTKMFVLLKTWGINNLSQKYFEDSVNIILGKENILQDDEEESLKQESEIIEMDRMYKQSLSCIELQAVCDNELILSQDLKFMKKIFENVLENLDVVDREMVIVLLWKLVSLYDDIYSLDKIDEELEVIFTNLIKDCIIKTIETKFNDFTEYEQQLLQQIHLQSLYQKRSKKVFNKLQDYIKENIDQTTIKIEMEKYFSKLLQVNSITTSNIKNHMVNLQKILDEKEISYESFKYQEINDGFSQYTPLLINWKNKEKAQFIYPMNVYQKDIVLEPKYSGKIKSIDYKMVADKNRLCDYLKISQKILEKNKVEVFQLSIENYLEYENEVDTDDKVDMKENLREIRWDFLQEFCEISE